MFENSAPGLLFYANLVAASGRLDAAIGMVEAVVDLRGLDADEISEDEFGERYLTVWTAP